MNWTLRARFFAWMTVHTLLIFACIGGVLLVFNAIETHEHPEMRAEEREEALMLAGMMATLLPVSLVGAWLLSGRLLRPIQRLVKPAERIGEGMLDERIQTPVSTDELGRLASALNRAFDRHRESRTRLQRFSADAAHQLRNPLAAIRTRGEVCLQYPRTPENYRETIGDMLDSTRRMSRTVEQLLMLADAGSIAPTAGSPRCVLALLVDRVMADANPIAEARRIRIDYKRPPEALAACVVEDLLREAAANLVDNALKFTPEGGVVRVDLTEPAPGLYRFSVRDTGPGVPPERRGGLFRPFQKGDADHEGVGLGLAIVADIAAAHGGSAGMSPGPDGGSEFWFTFTAVRSC